MQGSIAATPAARAASFGSVLQNALDGAIETGHTAETSAMQAISGEGNLTDVVTAISRAELALQTATAIRDRVVSGIPGHHEDADMRYASERTRKGEESRPPPPLEGGDWGEGSIGRRTSVAYPAAK